MWQQYFVPVLHTQRVTPNAKSYHDQVPIMPAKVVHKTKARVQFCHTQTQGS